MILSSFHRQPSKTFQLRVREHELWLTWGQVATVAMLTTYVMKQHKENLMDIFERNFFTSDIKVYAGIF